MVMDIDQAGQDPAVGLPGGAGFRDVAEAAIRHLQFNAAAGLDLDDSHVTHTSTSGRQIDTRSPCDRACDL